MVDVDLGGNIIEGYGVLYCIVSKVHNSQSCRAAVMHGSAAFYYS